MCALQMLSFCACSTSLHPKEDPFHVFLAILTSSTETGEDIRLRTVKTKIKEGKKVKRMKYQNNKTMHC